MLNKQACSSIRALRPTQLTTASGRSLACRATLALAGLLCFAPQFQAQSRDTQAVSLVNGALAALVQGSLTDATLVATVHSTVGSDDETVSGTFETGGPTTSKTVVSLATGTITETRNGQTGFWVGGDGTQHSIPLHNAINMQAWFFPAFIVQGLQQNTNYSLATPTAGTAAGTASSTQALTGYILPPGQMDSATTNILSGATAFELDLDPKTLLPVSLQFTAHPDDDATRGFPVLILYSSYQLVQGTQVPFHIQKFLQGTLTQDITVTSCTLNQGIPSSVFQVPQIGQ